MLIIEAVATVWLLTVTGPAGTQSLGVYAAQAECLAQMAVIKPDPEHSVECRPRHSVTIAPESDTRTRKMAQ